MPLSLANIRLGSKQALPPHLRERRHDDWPWPLSYTPRWVNAYAGEGPEWPQGVPQQPIPPPGEQTYHLRDRTGAWRPYYAFTLLERWHFRVGFRWDDVDHYYNLVLPWIATFKQVKDA